MEEKIREQWPDILRVAAACAVVLLHTVTGVMDHADMSIFPVQNKVFLILMDLTTWSVPVFIMISGYFFLDPEKEIGWRKIITKYCRRIVMALFLFGVPFACMEQVMTEGAIRPDMVGKAFVMVLEGRSWSHMWYLYLILLLYLLTPILRRILGILPLWGTVGLTAIMVVGCSLLPWIKSLSGRNILALPDGLVYLVYYLLGYLFVMKRRKTVVTKSVGCETGRMMKGASVQNGAGIVWKLTCALAAAIICILMIISRLSDSYTVRMAYNYPPTLILSLLLTSLCIRLEGDVRQSMVKGIRVLSSYSFTVYLIHPVFLNVMYKFLDLSPLSYPLYLSMPLFYAAVLLPTVLGAWVLFRIPVLRKYVL